MILWRMLILYLAPLQKLKNASFCRAGRPRQSGDSCFPGSRCEVKEPPRSRQRQQQVDQYSFALVRTADVALTRSISQELRDRGFNAYSMADSLEGIEDVARQMQAVLGGIGAITLLVAAIGITNTMVMSIYERTREIAIMKVVGASFADIRTMFLAESSLIGIIGGIIGIGLSYLISYLLNTYIGAAIGAGMVERERCCKFR